MLQKVHFRLTSVAQKRRCLSSQFCLLRNEKIKPESLLHVIGFRRQATLNANWFKDFNIRVGRG